MYPDWDTIPQFLPAPDGCFAGIFEGNVEINNKALDVWSLGKLVSFVFPRVLMFSLDLVSGNIGTLGKTKLTVSLGTIHYVYIVFVLIFQDQDGIAPQMFKSVIGRGHPEFSSNRQQDAQEFFMHLLSTMDRVEV